MDEKIISGDYTLSKLTEDDFADFCEACDSLEGEQQLKTFNWFMQKQNWMFFYIIRYQDEIIGYKQIRVHHHAIPFYETGTEIKIIHRNRGHCANVINLVVDYLRDTHSARRIQSVVPVNNKPCMMMMKKTCLTLEATLKMFTVDENHDPIDAHVYSAVF